MVSGRLRYIVVVGRGRVTHEQDPATARLSGNINIEIPPSATTSGLSPPRSPGTLTEKIRLDAFAGHSGHPQAKGFFGQDLPPSQFFPDTSPCFVSPSAPVLGLMQI